VLSALGVKRAEDLFRSPAVRAELCASIALDPRVGIQEADGVASELRALAPDRSEPDAWRGDHVRQTEADLALYECLRQSTPLSAQAYMSERVEASLFLSSSDVRIPWAEHKNRASSARMLLSTWQKLNGLHLDSDQKVRMYDTAGRWLSEASVEAGRIRLTTRGGEPSDKATTWGDLSLASQLQLRATMAGVQARYELELLDLLTPDQRATHQESSRFPLFLLGGYASAP